MFNLSSSLFYSLFPSYPLTLYYLLSLFIFRVTFRQRIFNLLSIANLLLLLLFLSIRTKKKKKKQQFRHCYIVTDNTAVFYDWPAKRQMLLSDYCRISRRQDSHNGRNATSCNLIPLCICLLMEAIFSYYQITTSQSLSIFMKNIKFKQIQMFNLKLKESIFINYLILL